MTIIIWKLTVVSYSSYLYLYIYTVRLTGSRNRSFNDNDRIMVTHLGKPRACVCVTQ
jgi:hypothetical protein